jgi:ABC-type multidrug transport system permease subunit
MTAHNEGRFSDRVAADLSYGKSKFFRDTWSIFEIKMLLLTRGWYLHIIRPLIFPLALFFWLRVIAPDDPEAVRRILTGALIFGFSLTTVNMLAQQLILDRFSGRLKLTITMPMSKAAYAAGNLCFAAVQVIPMLFILLALGLAVGVNLHLTWVFFLMLLPIMLTMGGFTFIIASYAPSQESGGILANLFGIVLVLVSPVFFSMEGAPLLLRLLGWISPMRYGADGIMKSLSGQTDVWLEFTILSAFSVLAMTLGVWKLRWRER